MMKLYQLAWVVTGQNNKDEKCNDNICEAGFVTAIHVNADMVAHEKSKLGRI